MSNLVFRIKDESEVIRDPLPLGLSLEIEVENAGIDNLVGLGVYIRPGSAIGEGIPQATLSPEQAFHDLLSWLSATNGELEITLPQNSGPDTTTVVTYEAGASYATRLPIKDLGAGETAVIEINWTQPAVSVAQRFFIDLAIE
jgi:hypothetical protein